MIMSGFGTDMVALACILGGAATGGAMTMALQAGGEDVRMDCAVETMSVGSQIVVTGDHGARAIVKSTPQMELHQAHDCQLAVAGEVRIHMEEVRREMEEARGRVEVVRIHMDEARTLAEEARASVDEVRLQEFEILLEKVEKVEKVEKGRGGRMD
jgi:ATP-dependent protease ClpP protease subunit